MKLKEIIVRAGFTHPNPYRAFANVKPEVELRATLADGDDPAECAVQLQEQANAMLVKHTAELLRIQAEMPGK